MDYYDQTYHHKEISSIKAVKYLLLCTVALLILGLITLASRLLVALLGTDRGEHLREIGPHWASSSQQQVERQIHLLFMDYGAIFIISCCALIATVKENFFFLITSAVANLLLGLFNLLIFSLDWSIIFLQLCSSLFTFVYTLSFYLKMKFDIRRKKRQEKMEKLRCQLTGSTGTKENICEGSLRSHSYDKLVLTNEWLRAQHSQLSEPSSRASTLCIAD